MPDCFLLGCDATWCGSIGMLWHVVWQHWDVTAYGVAALGCYGMWCGSIGMLRQVWQHWDVMTCGVAALGCYGIWCGSIGMLRHVVWQHWDVTACGVAALSLCLSCTVFFIASYSSSLNIEVAVSC
jgi:hypothetical protein